MLISRSDSVAANTRSPNVLAGEQFEFLPKASLVRFRASAAAVGVKCDLQIGSQTIISNGTIPGTNRYPVVPDDALVEFSGGRAERLFLTYTNTTGAAIVVQSAIEIL